MYVSHFGKPGAFPDFPVPTPLLHGSTYLLHPILPVLNKKPCINCPKDWQENVNFAQLSLNEETLAKMPIGLAQYQLHT